MCLAIPAIVEQVHDDRTARVSVLGVKRTVALDLVPRAEVGNYVLVHAGYAIDIINEDMAEETLSLIAEFPELAGAEAEGA